MGGDLDLEGVLDRGLRISSAVRTRSSIPTPALVVDAGALLANLRAMAALAFAGGVALRPHAKSHRSALVAALQVAAGAEGIACVTLAEASALVGGLARLGEPSPSVLLTSPVAGPAAAAAIWRLAERCRLRVALDHVDAVEELMRTRPVGAGHLEVLVDVDVGLGRTGVVGPDEAVRLARAVAASGVLVLVGVQGYGGHLQHIVGRAERSAATARSMARLSGCVEALRADGHAVPVVSGGGTGTAAIDVGLACLNELQPGSYVFMDREYRDALGDDPEGRFAQSLFVDTTVVSANHHGHVTVDAGLKAMATDAGPAQVVDRPGATYAFFGDEHGLVAGGDPPPLRGERLALVPPHCDPTVDRYDRVWVIEGERVLGTFAVTARARA